MSLMWNAAMVTFKNNLWPGITWNTWGHQQCSFGYTCVWHFWTHKSAFVVDGCRLNTNLGGVDKPTVYVKLVFSYTPPSHGRSGYAQYNAKTYVPRGSGDFAVVDSHSLRQRMSKPARVCWLRWASPDCTYVKCVKCGKCHSVTIDGCFVCQQAKVVKTVFVTNRVF